MAREYPIEKYRNIGIIAQIDVALRQCLGSLKPLGFNISATGKNTSLPTPLWGSNRSHLI